MIKLSEFESQILKEVSGGKDSYKYKSVDKEVTIILDTISNLKEQGYISAMKLNTKDNTGYTHVTLTEKGKQII